MKERIKKIRKESGLNQTDFGSRIGVKQSSVTGYESGTRAPMDAIIMSICREFNVNEEWLRYGTGEMHNVPEDERAAYVSYLLENVDDPVANLIASIMKTYLECDEKDKLVLRNFVDKLTNNKKRED